MRVYGKALEDSWAGGNDSRNFEGRPDYPKAESRLPASRQDDFEFRDPELSFGEAPILGEAIDFQSRCVPVITGDAG